MQSYPNLGKVILASASPRRRELLASLGLEFTVQIPAIEEIAKEGETPRAFAERLAAEKAAAVSADPGTTVIAADTIVVQSGNLLFHKTSMGSARLVIIDGLGDPAWLPMARWFRPLGRNKMRRRVAVAWPRIEAFAERGGVTPEQLETSSWGQGFLKHRDGR